MPTQDKIDAVEELRERLARCTVAISADYRGLSVSEMGALRRRLREAEVELRVVKNRLFRLAAQAAGQPRAADLAEGPTAVAFGYEDVTAPAKALIDYIRSARSAFTLRRAFLEGQILEERDISELAALPPREILAGRLAGALQAPVVRLASLLNSAVVNSPGRLLADSVFSLASLLEARAKQLEGAQ
jgi:large subunit ribosomal protein L10